MIEYLPLVLTGLSITASIIYYANVLRNQNKTQRLQILQNMWDWISTEEGYLNMSELMKMHWTDFEDFADKYGNQTNPENYAMRWAMWNKMHGLGYMVKEGVIDVETVYEHSGARIIWMWNRFEPIIMSIRELGGGSFALKWWEYLVNELENVAERRGDDFSDIPVYYTPDNNR
jgi:hypothetical protein